MNRFASFVAMALALGAQQPPPTISTQVPLVLAPATVTDRHGKLIDGLTAEDFVVTDEGVRQNITLDTSDTVLSPVALVVAVQASGISEPVLAKVRQVGGMIHPLITGQRGETALLAYDSEVRVLESFTTNSDTIRTSFAGIDARTIKNAVLTDAVGQAVRMLATRPDNYRRILLIVGESRDRGSKTKLKAAVEAAQRAGVIVYPLTYSPQAVAWTARPQDNPPLPGGMDLGGAIVEFSRMTSPNAADSLAFTSGGRHLSFATLKGLEDALAVTGQEIHSQYLLSFAPAAAKGEPSHTGYHRLSVRVPSRPDAIVRARPGYFPAE
ncbi:MAG TPA: VWA domain-containing protein [Bryobacteraceae bacterium]|nr:VWA domain-containing protein [Bryobacteraceae bacterium]